MIVNPKTFHFSLIARLHDRMSCITRFSRLTHCCLETPKRAIGKQCRPRIDAAERGVWSGSPLFAKSATIFLSEYLNLIAGRTKNWNWTLSIFCVGELIQSTMGKGNTVNYWKITMTRTPIARLPWLIRSRFPYEILSDGSRKEVFRNNLEIEIVFLILPWKRMLCLLMTIASFSTYLYLIEDRKDIPKLFPFAPYLALWWTLGSSNYPCLDQTVMVPKMFEPLKFASWKHACIIFTPFNPTFI